MHIKKRLVIVDDHAAVRAGVRAVVERRGNYDVVAERETTEGLEAVLESVSPVDAVIVDLTFPTNENAIKVIGRLVAAFPRTAILVLSAREDVAEVQRAILAGATGYVPKSTHIDKLVEALDAVSAGETYVHPCLHRALVDLARGVTPAAPRDIYRSLSRREREVLSALTAGLGNKAIAEQIGTSVGTVKTHLWRICQKFGVRRRLQAAVMADRDQYEIAGG